MIELLQEYWRPFLYSDGQHITGLAMTMWLLSASLVIGFLVSIPLSIARVSRNPFMRSISALIEAALAASFQLSSPASSTEKIAECAANHLRIVRAIAARDEPAARLAMENVIHVGVDRTMTALRADAPLANVQA